MFSQSENVAIAKAFGKVYTSELFTLSKKRHLMLESWEIGHPSGDSLYTLGNEFVLMLAGHPDYPEPRVYPRTPEGLQQAIVDFKAVT